MPVDDELAEAVGTADAADALSEAGADPGAGAPQRAERILAALPERYRAILQLRFLDGSSIAEAARALGVSVGNAKVLQHPARCAAPRR